VDKKSISKNLVNNLISMAANVEQLSRRVRTVALDQGKTLAGSIEQILDESFESASLEAPQEASMRSSLEEQVSGFSFLQKYLDDESLEEVWINEPGVVHYAKSGQHFRELVSFSAVQLKALVDRMIRPSGRRLDRTTPYIDAQLTSGFRLHAVIPDITREHLSLNIRKFLNKPLALDALVDHGVLTSAQAQFLVDEMRVGSNVLISGATQSGKTTLLSALLNSLPESERVISVEDTFELKCTLPDVVAMQTRPQSIEGKGEVDLRRLIRETLRMRPTRLVVGEVRGAEALDMLIALNSGIPGMCTIHANSATEGLQKLSTLPLLAGSNISREFLDAVIRSSMDLFVHCRRLSDGSRRIDQIMRVTSSGPLALEAVKV
jgi:pilus assembly protein CpaF